MIVATSTLELGIDVGDLDRVIQIDAPFTVASFLQRLGRTGRRHGALRNCLFLTTSDNALLRAAALLQLWEHGFVEPVEPPKWPLHLFAQQLMALALQEQGIGVRDWQQWIGRLPAFLSIPNSEVDVVINHLLEKAILFSDGVRLSCGNEGHALFGRRNFLELVSVFTTPPLFTVLHGRKELGSVHQVAFVRHRPEEPAVLSLGGKSWAVTSLDWPRRVAYVIPVEEKGKSRWLGTNFGFSFLLCQASHEVLADDAVSARWTTRAKDKMASIRQEHAFLKQKTDSLVVLQDTHEIKWFTFAGNIHNLAIADALRAEGYDDVTVSDFWIRLKGATDYQQLLEKIGTLTPEIVCAAFRIPEEFLEQLKFNQCLPHSLAVSLLKERLLKAPALQSVFAKARVAVLVRVED